MKSTDSSPPSVSLARAQIIADRYGALEHVRAVALGGSVAAGAPDALSDIDIYVYTTQPVSRSARATVAADDVHAEIDNRWFGSEDAWLDPATGRVIDVIFRGPQIEDELARVLVQHRASVGYTTAVWANVLDSTPLVDPSNWFARLQVWAQRPYPEPLRKAIIATNLPLLRQARFSYFRQLEKAVERSDRVSVNHRVAALLASYFDVLFAVNRLPHPGEKRLVQFALERCSVLPAGIAEQLEGLLRSAGEPGREVLDWAELLSTGIHHLLDQRPSSPRGPTV